MARSQSQHCLHSELLRALTSGDEAHLEELLTRQGDGHSRTGGRVTSTALHVVAGRGHAGLARRVCERAPSLVATRDGSASTRRCTARRRPGTGRWRPASCRRCWRRRRPSSPR
ncbi:unnamed protein product [Urochloa humidicola]